MNVLLIYANGVSEGYLPIGVAMISAVLKKAGHNVKVFDTSFYESDRVTNREAREKYLEYRKVKGEVFQKEKHPMDVDLKRIVEEFDPGLVGVSTTSSEYPFILPFIKKLKNDFDIPMIIGGVHPTVSPEEVIKEDFIDMLAIGEADDAIVELCDKMDKKEDVTKVRNIWVKKDGEIHKNPVRPLIQDLDTLPFPDWDAFDDRQFIRPYQGKNVVQGYFALGRGCPYACTYCVNQYLRDLNKGSKYYRFKSVDYIIKEIEAFRKKKKMDHIQFVDECLLSMPIEYIKKFVGYFKDRDIKFSFFLQTRPETITQEKIDLLKQLGTFGVGVGVESGNDRIRRDICNRRVSREQMIKSFDLMRKNNILIVAFSIIGFPEETRKEIFETIELNKRLKPSSTAVKFLDPFDGTEIKKMCEEKGYKIKSEKEKAMYYEDPLVVMPQISEKELKGLRKTFALYVKFPKILWPLIRICEGENYFSNVMFKLFGKIFWMKSS
ncbi:MAG: radical SAM protein [Nanoarchaeota archaeon]|nr:radical SAM protein [Nanoarchaeota archaeon]